MSKNLELKTRLTADNKDLKKKFEESKKDAKGFSDNLNSMKNALGGLAIAGFIKQQAGAVLALGDAVSNSANNAQIGTEAYQALANQAELTGASAGKLDSFLQKMNDSQVQALQGNQSAIDGFKALGIEMDALAGMGTEELLQTISQGFVEAGESNEYLNAMMGVAGKGAFDLQQVLVDVGENGLQTMVDKGLQAGTILSDELIKDFSAIKAEIDTFTKEITIETGKWLFVVVDFVKKISGIMGALSVVLSPSNWFGKGKSFKEVFAEALDEAKQAIENVDKDREQMREQALKKDEQKEKVRIDSQKNMLNQSKENQQKALDEEQRKKDEQAQKEADRLSALEAREQENLRKKLQSEEEKRKAEELSRNAFKENDGLEAMGFNFGKVLENSFSGNLVDIAKTPTLETDNKNIKNTKDHVQNDMKQQTEIVKKQLNIEEKMLKVLENIEKNTKNKTNVSTFAA